ncbi:fatty acid oxidation complex subunit alpha FadB [Sinimarinibacterium sp. NLF-5-8]|uniref:fatty acid oxidation complex subunit alpha FadB n=1 Tax=Sinimarinibacterium sp. NLF-5-8 TaxID=2698684 RepID=UPI00137C1CB6|nr:fatty acid oxidation complex subunit alpha FadB [Sinimarinibacterium sp. NLF-5-8]QHS09843.1 fatty acid oxidation complex subunit alpha FadB [Sinimarinibacterium sp. NLF-5-8]
MYTGQSIRVTLLDGGIAELCFDRQGEAINKFDARTVQELQQAQQAIAKTSGVNGLIVTSAKDVFIVGADITEFGQNFQRTEAEIAEWAYEANKIFSSIEDLPFPSCTAINGIALGGGFEMALSTDYRVMSTAAQVGLPETKLGIIPGFGGTVRLPRLIGADNAIEWIAGATQQKPDAALKVHAVDAVVTPEKLKEAAIRLVQDAAAGKYDWKARRAQKTGPLKLDPIESMMVFGTAIPFIQGKAGKHYPAPVEAVKSIQKAAGKARDEALKIEGQAIAKVAKTTVADSLIGLFLNDQFLKKKAKGYIKAGKKVDQAAVLGAGIMGGGIAYQSASKGTPIIMKDIADKALDLGMNEANKLLSKQVERKKLKPEKAGHILSTIRPTLNYGDFGHVNIVVEAVVENPKVKKSVLAEVESVVADGTIIASNTSSISIDELATVMKKPENFLGMHFFNPVHKMPLVEVIYGEKTSKEAIATVAAYAASMGKTPIVVKNCPGFLVNRILFPYFGGWLKLIRDGADFVAVDKVMENFGWPMGPAYLQDVVGIDTSHHVGDVLAEGYPDRMSNKEFRSALDVMYEAKRYGQKNGIGFFKYSVDPKGKPKKEVADDTYALLAEVQPNGQKEFSEEEIIDRLMLPMIIETVRCLDEGIVETPTEADMGLLYGIGFPPFRGGALKYADTVGLKTVLEKAAKYAHLGKLYEPTESMKQMAAEGKRYFPQ